MLPPVQPSAEVRADPVQEMLDLVAKRLASGQVQGLRRPLEEARRVTARQPESLQALRAEGLHGLLWAAEGHRVEGDEAWARAVRRIHGLGLNQRHLRPALRLPLLEVLHEALALADLEDIPVQEALLEARLDRNPAFDPTLEQACLQLIAHHYRGWLDPRPPDLPRLLPLAKTLARLWLRLPAPPRTGRVVHQALRVAGAEGVWKLVARKGDGELRALVGDLLRQLDPAFLDVEDEGLWRTLAALGAEDWTEPVRAVTLGMEARLRARLKAAPRDGVLAGHGARWYLAVGAPEKAVELLREALGDARLPEALRPGLLASFGAAAEALGDPGLLREARLLGCVLASPRESRPVRPDLVAAMEAALAERPGDPFRLMALVEACMGEDPAMARRGVEAALALWERPAAEASWPLARVEALVWTGCMAMADGRSREGLRRIQEALDGLPLMAEDARIEARKALADSALALELVPNPSRLPEVLPLLDLLERRLEAGVRGSVLFPSDDLVRQRWQRRAERAGRVAFVWE